MSSGDRIAREKALVLAEGVCKWLSGNCERIEIVGSIRREKATVGDIEIVCLPANKPGLNSALATLIENGSIKKKMYRQKTKLITRWGERMKSMVIHGVTCELYIADADNYGYIKWLRTGPADGNLAVVTRMDREAAAMRFHQGYGWITSYENGYPVYESKLHLPDEGTVFKCLGLGDVIDPKWRREDVYAANWKGVLPGYLLHEHRADEPKQRKLF